MRNRLRSLITIGLSSVLVLMLTGPLRAETTTSAWTLGGIACDLIPTSQAGTKAAAPPVGVGPLCSGVRPGTTVLSSGGQCSFNFMWKDSAGNRYMGTAGHCIVDEGEQRTWAYGSGPVASNNQGRIGEFVYAILQDPKDFALIRLDPAVPASAQMCHFGGPTGVNSDRPALTSPVVLNHFGNGIGVGTVLPARSALALGMPDPDHVYAEGAVVPGDSGSGIISSDGRAVGVIVTTGVHSSSIGTSGVDAGTMGVTRLAPQEARAEQVLGVGMTLQTAPLL